MPGPYVRSLAAGHTKIAIFSTKPGTTDALMQAIPVATMTAPTVLDAAPRILASDFKLGASGEDTVSEPPLSSTIATEVPKNSKYDGCQITPFRYFTSAGIPESGTPGADLGDAVFQAVSTMGTTLWIARRDTSKLSGDAWTALDPYQILEVITGEPQPTPQDGYIKNTVGLYVQNVWKGAVAA